MKKAPKIGERVFYVPKWFGNGCRLVGTVTKIYPNEAAEYDEDGDWVRDLPGLAPESEWQVCLDVECDLPADWPYKGTSKIAPAVRDIEYVEK